MTTRTLLYCIHTTLRNSPDLMHDTSRHWGNEASGRSMCRWDQYGCKMVFSSSSTQYVGYDDKYAICLISTWGVKESTLLRPWSDDGPLTTRATSELPIFIPPELMQSSTLARVPLWPRYVGRDAQFGVFECLVRIAVAQVCSTLKGRYKTWVRGHLSQHKVINEPPNWGA